VQGGEQAEEQSGSDGERAGERHDGGLQAEPHGAHGVRRQQGCEQPQGEGGHGETRDAAHQREDHRLRHQLADQVPPPGAEGEAHAHLLGTPRAARQEQVGDVGAGDEQHHPGDAEQHGERRGRFAVCLALPAVAGCDDDLLRLEACHGLRAHPLLERGFHVAQNRAVDTVQGTAGLGDGDAGLEPAEQIDPVSAPVLGPAEAPELLAHRDRDEQLRVAPERGPFEVARGHAHDGHGLAVDDDGLAHDRAVRAETALPEGVAQHGDESGPDGGVVFGSQQAAQGRGEAQRPEVRARDHGAPAGKGLTADGEVGTERAMAGESREDVLAALEVLEHRIAEDLVAATRIAA
jgi:hypothetical protein